MISSNTEVLFLFFNRKFIDLQATKSDQFLIRRFLLTKPWTRTPSDQIGPSWVDGPKIKLFNLPDSLGPEC